MMGKNPFGDFGGFDEIPEFGSSSKNPFTGLGGSDKTPEFGGSSMNPFGDFGGSGEGELVPISFNLDDDGYFDRACPNNECGAAFKVLFDDWKDKVSEDRAYCPICRHQDHPFEWNTPGQADQIEKVVSQQAEIILNEKIEEFMQDLNNMFSLDGFISVKTSYQSNVPQFVVPADASDVMTQKSTCEQCSCRYSSIGAAFFCPACGHNSAATTFQGSVDTVRNTLDELQTIEAALTKAKGVDVATDSVRSIRKNSFRNLVAAFQRFAEAKFDTLSNRSNFNPRRNVFQNLDESSALWQQAIGSDYQSMLSANEYAELQVMFQQRHVFEHKTGMVDQEYIDKSGDSRYAVGQRLVVKDDAVRRYTELLSKLSAEILKRT